ncbi:hypothetical protein KGM_205912A, partial [Danaus plexippus plexippus]
MIIHLDYHHVSSVDIIIKNAQLPKRSVSFADIFINVRRSCILLNLELHSNKQSVDKRSGLQISGVLACDKNISQLQLPHPLVASKIRTGVTTFDSSRAIELLRHYQLTANLAPRPATFILVIARAAWARSFFTTRFAQNNSSTSFYSSFEVYISNGHSLRSYDKVYEVTPFMARKFSNLSPTLVLKSPSANRSPEAIMFVVDESGSRIVILFQ